MTIQIDHELFLPKIHSKYGHGRYGDSSKLLAVEALKEAQGWFNKPPFEDDVTIDTKRECRISLKYYLTQQIDLRDRSKPFHMATFIWVWNAEKLLSYVAMLLINNYWRASRAESGSLYKEILKAHYNVD